MLRTLFIWLILAGLYGAFHYWYHGSGTPLTRAEIDRYMTRLEGQERDAERLAAVRDFMERDTGGEIFLVNLMGLRGQPLLLGEVQPGETTEDTLARYATEHMNRALYLRAGHLVLAGDAAGANLDPPGLDNGPAWDRAGVVRYRSRRDLMELATDPRFTDAWQYRLAATDRLLALPLEPARPLVNFAHLVAATLVALGIMLPLALRRPRSPGRW
jgi:hypothetical protein